MNESEAPAERAPIEPSTAGEPTELSSDPSAEELRHDQLTTAPNATEADAAPRIDVTDRGDGVRRIDIRDDSPVRPGGATPATSD